MQSSTSTPGQIAAAIAKAAVRNKVTTHSPAQIAHGHEEGEPTPILPVGELLDQLTGKTPLPTGNASGTETADTPS